MNISPDRTYLTPAELCSRYKRAISQRTLANWRSKGEGPEYTKIGGKVLYSLEDVTAWEKTRRMIQFIKKGSISLLGAKVLLTKAAIASHVGILWCLMNAFV